MKIQISIFKNTFKKGEKEPDYRISMVGANGGFQKAGAGWIKSTKTGDKYISATIDTELESASMIRHDIIEVPPLSPEEKAKLDKARDEEVRAKFTSKQDEEINASDVFNNF
jgi:uncharacterized protein (DUF736 family)